MTDKSTNKSSAIPKDIAAKLSELPAETLQEVAAYAQQLAAAQDKEAPNSTDGDSSEPPAATSRMDDGKSVGEAEDRPADVPARASITIKEINDNRYYYWQWREGDKVTSKYKGPVTPEE